MGKLHRLDVLNFSLVFFSINRPALLGRMRNWNGGWRCWDGEGFSCCLQHCSSSYGWRHHWLLLKTPANFSFRTHVPTNHIYPASSELSKSHYNTISPIWSHQLLSFCLWELFEPQRVGLLKARAITITFSHAKLKWYELQSGEQG